jgi:ribosomal protein S18 acetylase RimI-like enzyme
VGIQNDIIIASVIAGYEGHRSWVNYLAVNPEFQQGVYGRQIMQHAESVLISLGFPKINLQIRESNIQAINFYQALDYLDDKVIGPGKRLQDD